MTYLRAHDPENEYAPDPLDALTTEQWTELTQSFFAQLGELSVRTISGAYVSVEYSELSDRLDDYLREQIATRSIS